MEEGRLFFACRKCERVFAGKKDDGTQTVEDVEGGCTQTVHIAGVVANVVIRLKRCILTRSLANVRRAPFKSVLKRCPIDVRLD